ncbi:MAG: PqqD family protein [Lachnospiraceae bacterium]|jgi:hypothetical protein|nr:PqqD family protein [Lachnospiraceae bacterium]
MKINKAFVVRKIGDDFVLVPKGDTALSFNGLVSLNEAGAFLWGKLSEEVSESALVDMFLEEYETDRETAAKDVREFLENLRSADLIS